VAAAGTSPRAALTQTITSRPTSKCIFWDWSGITHLAMKGPTLTPLASEPFLLIASPGHLPTGSGSLSLHDLDGAGFVDFPPGWGTRVAIDQAFAAAGLERSVDVEVADVTTFIELPGPDSGSASYLDP